jgi:hypothetical protein
VGGRLGWGNPGFGFWVHAIERCSRGGDCLEPTAKTEPSGLGLGKRRAGGLVFYRGDPGVVGEVQLNRVGAVIGLVRSRGAGFTHLVSLSPWLFLSLSHSTKPPPNSPSLLPIPPRGAGDWPCAFVVGCG